MLFVMYLYYNVKASGNKKESMQESQISLIVARFCMPIDAEK